MQAYELTLQCDVFKTFRCQKAANSLDIDVAKKSIHQFRVDADLAADYSVGLIVGASGSGKSTLARSIWGDACLRNVLQDALPVIDQFPDTWTYDECAAALAGVGLTSVPCWIRPAYTLSTGQRARAECALQIARDGDDVVVMDEWTSVVDRTVAKVMSHCVQKHARRTRRRIVLLSCHYDVLEWLNPDWVIDCNDQTYTDRRSLCRHFVRSEQLQFDIREVARTTWRSFAKYHYLSERLPGGDIATFGLFHGADQIGFQCFANYVPHRKGNVKQMHSNRTVIHPDYAGLGLGIRLIDETSAMMHARGYDVRARYTSTPIFRSMRKSPVWQFLGEERVTQEKFGGNMERRKGFRLDVCCYMFRYVGPQGTRSLTQPKEVA